MDISPLEPVPVQLTRMEGTINLIAYQMTEVKDDLKHVQQQADAIAVRVTALELHHSAASGIAAAWRTWVPVVLVALGVLASFGFGIKWGA